MSGFSQQRLLTIFHDLLEHFGPQHWWPADSALEMVVGAILTQNTNWTNVETAIGNLKRAEALSFATLDALDEAELQALIRPSGYFRQKTSRLKNFLRHLRLQHRSDLENLLRQAPDQLRGELLSLTGIGPETADSIILYAARQPSFVIDAYTVRLLQRLRLIDGHPGYESLRSSFMSNLPTDVALFNEYHALIVRLCKNYCTRQQPRCTLCPLRPGCPTGDALQHSPGPRREPLEQRGNPVKSSS